MTEKLFKLGEFYSHDALDGLNEMDPNGKGEVVNDEIVAVCNGEYCYDFHPFERVSYDGWNKVHHSSTEDSFYRCVRIVTIDTDTGVIIDTDELD